MSVIENSDSAGSIRAKLNVALAEIGSAVTAEPFETLAAANDDSFYVIDLAENLVADLVQRPALQVVVDEVADLTGAVDALTASPSVDYETYETLAAVEGVSLVDEDGGLVASLASQANLEALEAAVDDVETLVGAALLTESFETLSIADEVQIVDAAGGLVDKLAGASRVAVLEDDAVTQAGTAASLAVRLDRGLTPYGDPLGSWCNLEDLHQSPMLLWRLDKGDAVQFVWTIGGDSWPAGGYFTAWLAKYLQDKFGFAGVGYVGFQHFGTTTATWVDPGTQPPGGGLGAARSDLVSYPVFDGTWTTHNGSDVVGLPSIGGVSSSDVGAYARFDFPAGHDAAFLHYTGDGTGSVRYSWDDGATWVETINLTSTASAEIEFNAVPAGAGEFKIEVVSGNVGPLGGVELTSASPGVRVNLIGCSGSNTAMWAAAVADGWADSVARLGSHRIDILLGTNAQNTVAPEDSADEVDVFMDAARTANPGADVVFVSSPENARTTNTIPMADYQAAYRRRAVASGFINLDLQLVFGRTPDEYKDGSARPWLRPDNIHPVNATGGAAVARALTKPIMP